MHTKRYYFSRRYCDVMMPVRVLAVKLKFHGSSFLVASLGHLGHPREGVANMSRGNLACGKYRTRLLRGC